VANQLPFVTMQTRRAPASPVGSPRWNRVRRVRLADRVAHCRRRSRRGFPARAPAGGPAYRFQTASFMVRSVNPASKRSTCGAPETAPLDPDRRAARTHRGGERGDVVGRHEQAGDAVLDQLAVAPDRRRDDRLAPWPIASSTEIDRPSRSEGAATRSAAIRRSPDVLAKSRASRTDPSRPAARNLGVQRPA